MTKKQSWEDKFDKNFTREDGLIDKYSWYGVEGDEVFPQPMTKAIKQFITKAISQAKAEERERIVGIIDKSRTVGEEFGVGIAEQKARDQVKVDILLNKLKQ